MSNFIVTDRKTRYLLPPSVDDWLVLLCQIRLQGDAEGIASCFR